MENCLICGKKTSAFNKETFFSSRIRTYYGSYICEDCQWDAGIPHEKTELIQLMILF